MWKIAMVLIPVLIVILLLFYFFAWNVKKMLVCKGVKVNGKIFYPCAYLTAIIIIWSRSVFAIMILYGLMLFVFAAVVRKILMFFNLYERTHKVTHFVYQNGITVLVIGALLSMYAAYNARNNTVTEYDVVLNKPMEEEIDIGFVSDIHMGTAVGQKELDKLVRLFDTNEPDIICLGGDIFDESTSDSDVDKCCKALNRLAQKYPVYYIKGNHDDGAGDDYIDKLKAAGVKILDDEYVITDGICLVGRTDEGMGTDKKKKKPLKSILDDEIKKLPVVVLNHRPTAFEEEEKEGANLVISGHTHNGQVFPGNLTIGLFNDLGYGRYDHESFHAIVSSGYGVWYFPVRTGSHSEIVMIHLSSSIK